MLLTTDFKLREAKTDRTEVKAGTQYGLNEKERKKATTL